MSSGIGIHSSDSAQEPWHLHHAKQHRRGVILAPMLDHADRCNEIALAFYLSTYDYQFFVMRAKI
jgi:hypothetical protein